MVVIYISVTILFLVSALVLIGNRMSKSKKMSIKQKKWWLVAHIVFAIVYCSGVLGQLLVAISSTYFDGREQIYTAHLFILYFDNYLIVPGGLGSLITGVWLAVRTHYGFTQYYWIIAKWVGNISAIPLGASIIGGRVHHAFPQIFSSAIHPLQNPHYHSSLTILFVGIMISIGILLFLVIISVLKPWGKRAKYIKFQPQAVS